MNNIVKPDYRNSIVNITASILKYYGVNTDYSSIDMLEQALKGNYKNVLHMVFDGMGVDMLEQNLPKDSFLRRNNKRNITSVFPPTTTAAMTAYYTGLAPKEHGWIGWSAYFKEFGRNIDLFTNLDSFTQTSVGAVSAAHSLMPYETVYKKIHDATEGEVKVYTINPSGITVDTAPNINLPYNEIDEIFDKVKDLCKTNDKKYILSYCSEPDNLMHRLGCYSDVVKITIQQFDKQIEEMCRDLKDTLVIISADHGQINVSKEVFLDEITEIDECLIMPPTVEPRAVSFFVKPEMKETFKTRFNNLFGDDFILYTKDEVINSDLLGCGKIHKKIYDFVGDFLACGTGNVLLRYKTLNSNEKHSFKGHHAGLTDKEMLVPFIMVEAK